MAKDDGGRVRRIVNIIDERAEERGRGLVAPEDVGFVSQAPVASDALDDALVAAQVSARWSVDTVKCALRQ